MAFVNADSIRLGDLFSTVGLVEDPQLERLSLPTAAADEAETPDGKHTVEFWANTKGTPPAFFWAVKMGSHWPNGAELLEADYDAAILAAGQITIR